MIKLVIIDIDDTLCLTERACFSLENEIGISLVNLRLLILPLNFRTSYHTCPFEY